MTWQTVTGSAASFASKPLPRAFYDRDTVAVAREVKAALAQVQREVPPGVTVSLVHEKSKFAAHGWGQWWSDDPPAAPPGGFAQRKKVEPGSAVDFMVRTVMANPAKVAILAIGPLTNVATAIRQEPGFAQNVKQVVIMGGAVATLPDVPAGHDTAPFCVLYIEDNPANLKLVQKVLEQRRHTHMLAAHTPELGLDLARIHRPDIILLDINLPGMSGYEVREVLRGDDRLSSIPVIAITASAMPDDVKRVKAAGFDGYLAKPLDIRRFLELLDWHLSAGSRGVRHEPVPKT